MTGRLVSATAPNVALSDDQEAPAQPLVIVTTPDLVTVPNVEIVEVGDDWETSTGVFSFTVEDVQSAVASQSDPSVRTPIIKLGHTDPRFNTAEFNGLGELDGQPALGRADNLRLTNNGMTLVCDYVGVPRWLAEIMASAYPRRSFEGKCDFTTHTGNTWPLIVDAVALLGTAYPAINTLEDIQALYGSKPPELFVPSDPEAVEVAAMTSNGSTIKARKVSVEVKWKRKNGEEVNAAQGGHVAASASLDDVRSAFYDSLGPNQMWWWVRQVLISPLQLVVDDDEGGLWTVDVTVDAATDTVTFGDPVAVKVEYVAAAKASGLARPGQMVASTFVSAEAAGARPRATIQPEQTTDAPASEEITPEEEQPVKLTPEVYAALGLAEDASDADISAAIIARGQSTPSEEDGNPDSQPETPATDPTAQPATAPDGGQVAEPPAVPEGSVLVDAEQWAAVQESMRISNEERVAAAAKANSDVLAAAVKDGKFPFSRLEHYQTLMASDPQGTRELIGKMAPGLIPTSQRGTATGPGAQVAATDASYPDAWKATVATNARRVGVRASNGVRITNAHDKAV